MKLGVFFMWKGLVLWRRRLSEVDESGIVTECKKSESEETKLPSPRLVPQQLLGN